MGSVVAGGLGNVLLGRLVGLPGKGVRSVMISVGEHGGMVTRVTVGTCIVGADS